MSKEHYAKQPPREGRFAGDAFECLEVKIDLEKAFDQIKLSRDQRALVMKKYFNPDLSELEAGRALGWDLERLDRVAHSLRADRNVGYGLRLLLVDYIKSEKSEEFLIESVLKVRGVVHDRLREDKT